jgi:hypothetical protein
VGFKLLWVCEFDPAGDIDKDGILNGFEYPSASPLSQSQSDANEHGNGWRSHDHARHFPAPRGADHRG